MSTTNQTAAFTAGLRALADLLDANPDLTLPSVSVCALELDVLDVYAQAFAAAGITYRDSSGDHSREVTGQFDGLWLPVTKVHEESMLRYRAEREFLANHKHEIDKAAAAAHYTEQAKQARSQVPA